MLSDRHARFPLHHFGRRMLLCLSVVFLFLSGCQSTPTGDKTKTFSVEKDGKNLKITEKLEPAIKYFSTQKTMSADELKEKAKGIAELTGTAIAKNPKLDKHGPLTLVYQDLISMSDDAVTAKIGFPVRGYAKITGQYSLETKPEFKCLSLEDASNRKDPKGNWLFLYDVAEKKGYKLNGEARTVVTLGLTGIKAELQLGVL